LFPPTFCTVDRRRSNYPLRLNDWMVPDLSEPARSHHRRLRPGRSIGHPGSVDRATADRTSWSPVHRGKSAGSSKQHRGGGRRARSARRLHIACHDLRKRDERLDLPKSWFRSFTRYCPGCDPRFQPRRHGSASVIPGQLGAGVHRLRKVQSRQSHDGHFRKRVAPACLGRNVQDDVRCGPDSCSISRGLRASACRPDGWSGRCDVRSVGIVDRADQSREDQAPRRHLLTAVKDVAPGSCDRRVRCGL
jgi:hypothetical protein